MFIKFILLSTLVACGFAQSKDNAGGNSAKTPKKRPRPVCTCDNGSAAQGAECPYSSPRCSDCDEGFVLDELSKTCQKPVCRCPFGTPATGADCPESRTKCADCNSNYVLTSENRCKKPIISKHLCTCDFGTAATGTDCPRTMSKCASCQPTYVLNTVNNRCEKECLTTKNIKKVCCNGQTYQNPSLATCGDDSKKPPLPPCRGATEGSCETKCSWPDHTQTTCDDQRGCSWVSTQ